MNSLKENKDVERRCSTLIEEESERARKVPDRHVPLLASTGSFVRIARVRVFVQEDA